MTDTGETIDCVRIVEIGMGVAIANEKEETMDNKIELNGLDSLRLLSAFQALRMPSKCYGVTHKQARDIIEQLTGKRPKGKPETSGNLEHYLSWHFGCVAGRW